MAATVVVAPIWDGPPDAPDATPALIGVRLTVRGRDPVLSAAVDIPLAAAERAWGHLGDLLRDGGLDIPGF